MNEKQKALEDAQRYEQQLRHENALSWLESAYTLGGIKNLLEKHAPVNLTIRVLSYPPYEKTETTRTIEFSYAGKSIKVQMSIVE